MNTVSVDVGSLLEAKYRLTEAVKKLGHVDVLVNCAGITHTDTLVNTPSEKFQVPNGDVMIHNIVFWLPQ